MSSKPRAAAGDGEHGALLERAGAIHSPGLPATNSITCRRAVRLEEPQDPDDIRMRNDASVRDSSRNRERPHLNDSELDSDFGWTIGPRRAARGRRQVLLIAT